MWNHNNRTKLSPFAMACEYVDPDDAPAAAVAAGAATAAAAAPAVVTAVDEIAARGGLFFPGFESIVLPLFHTIIFRVPSL